METCSTTPLRTISALPDNPTSLNKKEDVNMEISSTKPELEIVTEQLSGKKELKVPTTTPDNKLKKSKIKKCRGEKRKISEKLEITKKIKRKKKEEKTNLDSSFSQMQNSSNEDVVVATTDKDESVVENDSDAENKGETQLKQKSKQMSARKSKAVATACKHTFDVLLQLGVGTLGTMDESLRILKSHNFLNSKYVPIDTLMELISLALETNRRPEVVETDKELMLSKIVSKLTVEMCSTPKALKARQSFGSISTSSPVAKVQPLPQSNTQEEQPEPVLVSPQVEETEISELSKVQDENEKLEEADTSIEIVEKSQTSEPPVEKSGKNFRITNYFKKLKKTVEERDKNERFSSFTAKTDMTIAPKLGGELTGERREKFEVEFTNQNCEVKNLFHQYSSTDGGKGRKSFKLDESLKIENVEVKVSEEEKEKTVVHVVEDKTPEKKHNVESERQNGSNPPARKRIALTRVDIPKPTPVVEIRPNPVVSRTKAKLLQFHDNRRPPYWGTWRRKSDSVGPKTPFAKDKLLNYEVDSDDEWEEEEEPGESLHGSDDEKEPEEDYEVDNDFFVPHGYLSDDENPEKETMSPKKKEKLDLLEEQFTSEQKQKTRKMTPFVFGTFWVHNGIPSEGSLYQDLQIESLQIVPWTSLPIYIEDEEDKKNESITESTEPTSQVKKSKQKIFPDDEIPNLIKMIHGSPQACEVLAKKFLHYWGEEKGQDGKRRGLTKVCVLKKIKELATWQDKGKYWQVPKETRKEFGADEGVESPQKKPQKCFIWKFVKKAEKSPGMQSPNPNPEPEVVILES